MDGLGIKFFINDRWVELDELIEKADKFDAIKSWWSVFNQTIDSPGAKERLAEVLEVEN